MKSIVRKSSHDGIRTIPFYIRQGARIRRHGVSCPFWADIFSPVRIGVGGSRFRISRRGMAVMPKQMKWYLRFFRSVALESGLAKGKEVFHGDTSIGSCPFEDKSSGGVSPRGRLDRDGHDGNPV